VRALLKRKIRSRASSRCCSSPYRYRVTSSRTCRGQGLGLDVREGSATGSGSGSGSGSHNMCGRVKPCRISPGMGSIICLAAGGVCTARQLRTVMLHSEATLWTAVMHLTGICSLHACAGMFCNDMQDLMTTRSQQVNPSQEKTRPGLPTCFWMSVHWESRSAYASLVVLQGTGLSSTRYSKVGMDGSSVVRHHQRILCGRGHPSPFQKGAPKMSSNGCSV